jgi:hypothetical protein
MCYDMTRGPNSMCYKIGVVWEAVGSEVLTVRGVSRNVEVVFLQPESWPAAIEPFSRHSQPSPSTHV